MRSAYEFLPPEDRAWLSRSEIVAVLLFLGVVLAIAFADDRFAASADPQAVAARGPFIAAVCD